MIQVFKILKGIDNVQAENWFCTVGLENRPGTRMASHPLNLIRQSVSRTDLRNNFFSQRVISHWNQLPNWVKDSTTVAQFKRNYSTHLDAGAVS